ncbi:Dolichyl-phosphate-mannose--protein mannosyltransferase 1 [Tilletia horrida]|uniref:Dolichyl-phosphate-mannose--protein mannosyltransferase n=1 Tax=Tilletia horrida TaxID=155126 RepID=A0AAN6GL77_9BASI|nr:Dolichyl-phosphate-mannose--protein mannosyltransferase 1 [Tilletia horrida]KAK0561274.1 Dolichyl-phosphate-mannose--protein mannosyltransferase 1 [Tilletia horrida]
MASSSYEMSSSSMRARPAAGQQAPNTPGVDSTSNFGTSNPKAGPGASLYGSSLQRPGSPQLKRHLQQKQASLSPTALWNISPQETRTLIVLVAVAAVVRLWRLSAPSSVVFDEVHFGGFASKYIRRKFFMDVHPPLAKLMFTFVAWLSGFNGAFDFADIGKEYMIGDNTPVPYVAMRTLPALLGTATVPIAYLSLRALGLRITSALLGALAVLFDNALTTQSRLILLDSPLVFFTSTTALSYITFANADRRAPFTREWWTWLFLTGLNLGAVASCKWVGFFTVATVGACTIVQLWNHLGDTRLPISAITRHFFARAVGLIAVPFLVYYSMFGIHLSLLTYGGDGDPFLSPAFRHTLNDHNMADTFADVSLGSTVTLRHVNTQGGYLHSHNSNYPAGSQQQQITLYPHIDNNNNWVIVPAPHDTASQPLDDEGVPLPKDGPDDLEAFLDVPLRFVEHGMEVRLVHKSSSKRLHSHDNFRPPVSESDFQNEVTAYGFPGFSGDYNDNFFVEIEEGDSSDPVSSKRLRALRSVFRLRHALTGCYLFSHKVSLPDWGFGQQEVTCNKNPTIPNSLWYIETNTHPLLERALAGNLTLEEAKHVNKGKKPALHNYVRPSFWKRFWELNSSMWSTNKRLTDRHAYDSRPRAWPFLRRGINFWAKGHRQIYLIGNPVVWWSASTSVLAYVGIRALLMLRAKRGYRDFNNTTVAFYDKTAAVAFTGWAMHYLPFYLMSRQLFIHHYLPALYFSILLLAIMFDLATSPLRPQARLGVAGAFIFLVLIAFNALSPLTYASRWTTASCKRARLLKTWDFDCDAFPASKSEYSAYETHVKLSTDQLLSHAIKATPDVVKSASTTQEGVVPEILPEPGRHAFDEAPLKAKQSPHAAHPGHVDGDHAAEDKKPAGNSDKAATEKVGPGKVNTGAKAAADEIAVDGLDADQLQHVALEGTQKALSDARKQASKEADAAAKGAATASIRPA